MSRRQSYKKIKFSPKKLNLRRNNNKLPKELSNSSSGDYVVTNQEEMDMLSKYILDYRNIETGGQLFGYWTFDGKPVVLFVLGPGPKAGHYGSFFMQDLDYLKTRAAFLKQKYGLDHIGEWHSHHQLGLDHPSGHDASNMIKNIRRLGYSRFLLCIGTCTSSESSINAFMFTLDSNNYNQVPWLIKNIESPYRKLIDANDAEQFEMPRTTSPNMQRLFIKETLRTKEKINFNSTYWLKRGDNSLVLKRIIESMRTAFPTQDCVPTIDNNQEVHIETYQSDYPIEDIHFPKEFPVEPPVIRDLKGNRLIEASLWNFNGDIFNAFITYYHSLKNNKQ